MRIYGKLIETISDERIIRVDEGGRLVYLYMTRKVFKDFSIYFKKKPYVFVDVKEDRRMNGEYCVYDVNYFEKIFETNIRGKITYYDINTIRVDTGKLLEKLDNRMFLDLEFSLPAYYQSIPHIAEIVQYGIVIENSLGEIIHKESALVKPKRRITLNNRTLKFLSREREEFDNAINYTDFYNSFKELIAKYNPKIIAWGKSDLSTLEASFKVNNVKNIQLKKRYINIMQLIKNYYNYKDEMGLFQTYEDMTGVVLEPQAHDALEDAMVTREIYHLFIDKIHNDEKK